MTDLASIPRVFYSVLKPDGPYAHAAVAHDFLYWQQATTREVADEIFRQHMIDLKVDSRVVWTIHTAVRNFGEAVWKANRELKTQGEKRVLAEFPTDPSVTWAAWKSNPSVFAPDAVNWQHSTPIKPAEPREPVQTPAVANPTPVSAAAAATPDKSPPSRPAATKKRGTGAAKPGAGGKGKSGETWSSHP